MRCARSILFAHLSHPCTASLPPRAWPQVELDRERGRDLKSRQYNVRFYGNPGTGKTTVARLYAGLLQELGVLPGAAVEETSGAALANAGLSGLKEQLKKLDKGGVLFIDEAYQLNPKTNPMGAQVGRGRGGGRGWSGTGRGKGQEGLALA